MSTDRERADRAADILGGRDVSYIAATFEGGPWHGRRDVAIEAGRHTVNVAEGGGVYTYNGHAVIGDVIVQVDYRWTANRERSRFPTTTARTAR